MRRLSEGLKSPAKQVGEVRHLAKEKEAYRDNLERLDAAFPDAEILSFHQVCKFLRMDPRTAAAAKIPFKTIGVRKSIISKATLARYLS